MERERRQGSLQEVAVAVLGRCLSDGSRCRLCRCLFCLSRRRSWRKRRRRRPQRRKRRRRRRRLRTSSSSRCLFLFSFLFLVFFPLGAAHHLPSPAHARLRCALLAPPRQGRPARAGTRRKNERNGSAGAALGRFRRRRLPARDRRREIRRRRQRLCGPPPAGRGQPALCARPTLWTRC